MVSSLFQVFFGFTGLIGVLLRFIGPITVAPTITLVGLSLFGVCSNYAGKLCIPLLVILSTVNHVITLVSRCNIPVQYFLFDIGANWGITAL